jgi:hypothetical protein
MAKLERRGKPYNDTRNWPEYNEQLVKRGTLYLSLEFLEHWDQYFVNLLIQVEKQTCTLMIKRGNGAVKKMLCNHTGKTRFAILLRIDKGIIL